ncbi:hypothetical protein [Arthrobacter sp. D1-17]
MEKSLAWRITDCRELRPGDVVEAHHNGLLYYAGKVTETVPVLGMFWILEIRTGTRKLIDPLAYVVVRSARSGEQRT